MKKILLLLTSTVFLFACNHKSTETSAKGENNLSTGDIKIAVINTDTILAHFDMVVDKQSEIEKTNTKLSKDLEAQQARLKADYDNYLKIGATLTLSEQQKKEASIQQRGQQLGQLEQQYTQQLAALSAQSQIDITNAIYNFVEKYNKEHQNFDLILTHSRLSGGATLYANPALDITKEIIEALNADYAASLKAKK
ncbi:MAG: OmpH family outer membrane protein [Bacteroidales bacterium]|jgi:outer membrane protein|nr:OmpH family outer membrane protein [Bacteroidales bacterium]